MRLRLRRALSGTSDAVTTTFTYEPTYSQVSSVIDPLGHTSTFAYDSLGNLITAWNGNSVTHDFNGNMTAALGQTYTWNERNQLTASTGSATATFAYDSEGRRRAKTVNGNATNFLYDGRQPIQELTSSNVMSATLLTGGIDEIFSRSAGGVTQTFIVDALGSTVRLTDTAGAKDVDYTYEAYGKVTNDNASNTNTFQYTGRENDGTQLQFNRARYYDPRLARFISEDPIGLAGGYNEFSYVQGNPISLIDPTGEFGWAGAGYGAVAGGIGGYISGGWTGALYGAGAGAVVGFANPFASSVAGAAAGAAAASLLGQAAGNAVAGKSLGDPCNYDFTAAAGAAAGGALGGPVNHLITRFGPIYRGSEIGRAVGGQSISRSPAMTLGATAEGALVGGGELAGSGRGNCSCTR